MASSEEGVDAYTQFVLGQIEPRVFSTLNLVQLEAIRRAISASAPYQRHGIDLRGTLNFYVAKYYFVILMGRDRRSAVRNKEMARRQKLRGMSTLAFLYLVATASIPLLFLALYLVKTLAGIDLLPSQHLLDFFKE